MIFLKKPLPSSKINVLILITWIFVLNNTILPQKTNYFKELFNIDYNVLENNVYYPKTGEIEISADSLKKYYKKYYNYSSISTKLNYEENRCFIKIFSKDTILKVIFKSNLKINEIYELLLLNERIEPILLKKLFIEPLIAKGFELKANTFEKNEDPYFIILIKKVNKHKTYKVVLTNVKNEKNRVYLKYCYVP